MNVSDAAWTPAPGAQRTPHLRMALLLLIAVVLTGSCGLMLIEGWGFWKAFFFTLITITTVGYGDEGISPSGEKFATVLLVGGIAVASYTFALLVQHLVANTYAWRRRMQSRIDKLENHTIVCGFGRMGRTICSELAASDAPFVVIDCDPAALAYAYEHGYLVVEGIASDDELLERAGLQRASHLVSVVDSEAENIVITLTARDIRPDLMIIARAEGDSGVRKLRRAGATSVTSPFQTGGLDVANRIVRPKVADFVARSARAGSDLVLAEIKIEEGSSLVGQTLQDYGCHHATHVSYVALERPGEEARIPPPGREEFRVGDLLIVAGNPRQISEMGLVAQDEKVST